MDLGLCRQPREMERPWALEIHSPEFEPLTHPKRNISARKKNFQWKNHSNFSVDVE